MVRILGRIGPRRQESEPSRMCPLPLPVRVSCLMANREGESARTAGRDFAAVRIPGWVGPFGQESEPWRRGRCHGRCRRFEFLVESAFVDRNRNHRARAVLDGSDSWSNRLVRPGIGTVALGDALGGAIGRKRFARVMTFLRVLNPLIRGRSRCSENPQVRRQAFSRVVNPSRITRRLFGSKGSKVGLMHAGSRRNRKRVGHRGGECARHLIPLASRARIGRRARG